MLETLKKIWKNITLSNRAGGLLVQPWAMTYGEFLDMKARDYMNIYGPGEYSNVWVYACVKAIAQTVASINLKFYQVDRKGDKRLLDDKHPLIALFWGPNPHMARLDFWEATMIYLELTGNCLWSLEGINGMGQPGELWPLRPDYFRIVKDPEKKIKRYDFVVGAQKVSYEPEEIIHIKYFNPIDEYWGLSPLASARLGIIADFRSVEYNAQFFKQGARPSGILSTENELDDTQFKRLKSQVNEGYAGVDRAHKILLLEKGLTWQQISIPQKDMEFIEQRKLSREEVLSVFKVPPVEVGVFEYANYANAEIQEKMFWTKCIMPRLKKLEETLNTFLVRRYSKDIFCEFDLSGVEALRENEALKMSIARQAVGNGLEPPLMTVNEARRRFLRLGPIEEVRAVERQGLEFLRSLGTVSLAFRPEDFIADSLEANNWLLDKAKIFHMDTLSAWGRRELSRIKKGVEFNKTDPRVINFLKKQGASLVSNINDTTRKALSKALAEATEKGEAIPQIADRIREVFREATESRAFMIARTETVGASNFGALEAYRQAGVEGKGWITAGDEKVRPTHVQAGRDYADGIPLEDLFLVGGYQMERPGDSSHGADAGEIVNCRCTLKPSLRLKESALEGDEANWEQFAVYLSPREKNFEETIQMYFRQHEKYILERLEAVK